MPRLGCYGTPLSGLLLALLAAPLFGGSAMPVSPGSFAPGAEAGGLCPTFSWSPAPGSGGSELALLELGAERELESARIVLRHQFEGLASSWTPARSDCLSPGHEYAWVVRPLAGKAGRAPAEWSVPLYFSVPDLPSEEEIAAALELLERFGSASGGAMEPSSSVRHDDTGGWPDRPAKSGPRPDAPLAGGPAAMRGEMTETTGTVHGVFGVTYSAQGAGVVARNEAGGPDLVLDGATQGEADMVLTESGFDRASPDPSSFDFGNSGGGAMMLTVDSAEVVTVLTDQDTMGGLSCGGSEVAKRIGGVWSCAADEDTLGGLVCAEGEVAKRIGTAWTCAADEGEYFAGNQLELAGATLHVLEGPGSGLDADTLDGMQASAFAPVVHPHAGEDIVTGTVAEPRIAASVARDAEILPTVLAGDGSGSTLDADLLDGLDGLDLQVRVTGICPAGQALQEINADGSVVCSWLPLPPRITTVDDSANRAGWATSIAIGTDGFPVISYVDGDASLKVAKCNDAACAGGDETITTVNDPTNAVGNSTSIAIGTDGLPVIGYWNGSIGDLKVAKCNDAACAGEDETIATVDASANSVGWYVSLAIGSDGLPVISYYDFNANDLKVAKCNDAACDGGDETITIVDGSPNLVGRYTSIAIGADGLPVISYQDLLGDHLKVAKCNDPACAGGDETISTVDGSPNQVGYHTSLAIGTDGFPVIGYLDLTAGNLKVAKCNDAACTGGDETITTVDASPNYVGWYTSIAIGADGFPVISYRDSTAKSLKVAKCNDATCSGGDVTITTVDDPANDVGYYSSLAIGPDGFPVISCQDFAAKSLKVVRCHNPDCVY